MNNARRFSFLVGVLIGAAIAILELRGIQSLAADGREWVQTKIGRNGSEHRNGTGQSSRTQEV